MTRLRPWERAVLVLTALALIGFGVLTEIRSCYLGSRRTDADTLFRAAYAVRTGGDIYQATDDNGLRYIYPPALAVALVPLADAPSGQPRDGLLPFPVSVAIWTILNLLLMARIVHVLASLAVPDAEKGGRLWWSLRMVPFYTAAAGLLYTVSFGQVNMIVIAMLVEMLRARFSGRDLEGGLWLAGAIVVKIMPAYLLLYPFTLRSTRMFAGVAAGLLVGLVLIPLVGLGPAGTLHAYQSLIGPVLVRGVVGTDAKEVLAVYEIFTPNDSQSFLALIHNNLHFVSDWRAVSTSAAERLSAYGLSAVLTLITLMVAWRRGLASRIDNIIFVGALMLLMSHITPISHMHYYAFGVVLVAGLWFKSLAGAGGDWPGWRSVWPLTLWSVGVAITMLPGPFFQALRDHCLGTVCSLVLWLVALMRLGAPEAARIDYGGATGGASVEGFEPVIRSDSIS